MSPQVSVSTQQAISRQKYGTALFAIGVALASGIGFFNKLRENRIQAPSETALPNGMKKQSSSAKPSLTDAATKNTVPDDRSSTAQGKAAVLLPLEQAAGVQNLKSVFEPAESSSNPPVPKPQPRTRRAAQLSEQQPSAPNRSETLPQIGHIGKLQEQLAQNQLKDKQRAEERAQQEKNETAQTTPQQKFRYLVPARSEEFEKPNENYLTSEYQADNRAQEAQNVQEPVTDPRAGSSVKFGGRPDITSAQFDEGSSAYSDDVEVQPGILQSSGLTDDEDEQDKASSNLTQHDENSKNDQVDSRKSPKKVFRPRTETANSRFRSTKTTVPCIQNVYEQHKNFFVIAIASVIAVIICSILLGHFLYGSLSLPDAEATPTPVPFNVSDNYNATEPLTIKNSTDSIDLD